jgi:hypothetical protein
MPKTSSRKQPWLKRTLYGAEYYQDPRGGRGFSLTRSLLVSSILVAAIVADHLGLGWNAFPP